MNSFVAIAIAMVLIALAWVLVPLIRNRSAQSVARRAANLSIYQDQLTELDADLARGTLSSERYAESKSDIERRVLEEAKGQEPVLSPPRRATWTAWNLALALPVFATALYSHFGQPQALDPLIAQATDSNADQHELSADEANKLIAQLDERLQKDPKNAEGWLLMARSLYSMRRFDEAATAYERVIKLVPEDAMLLADYADALAMSQGRRIDGEPLALIKRSLALDPKQWKALAMAGNEAFDRKDYAAAADYWGRLRQIVSADSPISQSLQSSIDEARKLGGLSPVTATSSNAQSASSAGAGSVSGRVSLSAALASRAAPEDTVFVFARAAQGPRMPLAILKVKVKDLPINFALNDSMAMAPEMKLSSFPQVVVGARVSKSGAAIAASGDLQGTSQPVANRIQGLTIVIDQIVQ